MLHRYPTDWKIKIIKYLGNDGARDYWLCEHNSVFAHQPNHTHYVDTLDKIENPTWK